MNTKDKQDREDAEIEIIDGWDGFKPMHIPKRKKDEKSKIKDELKNFLDKDNSKDI